jgi:hypothetical protein
MAVFGIVGSAALRYRIFVVANGREAAMTLPFKDLVLALESEVHKVEISFEGTIPLCFLKSSYVFVCSAN